jgi:RND superfamily putative drug exporter
LGVGLAVAVLLDATVVRGVLLPASMRLLGERNWYLPRWLRWLPRIDHGPAVHAPSGLALPTPRPPVDPASDLVAR